MRARRGNRITWGSIGTNSLARRTHEVRDAGLEVLGSRGGRSTAPGRQPTGIQRDDGVIEAVEPSLTFPDDLRLELTIPIPGHFDRDLTAIGL